VEELPAPVVAAPVNAGKQVGAWLDTVGSMRRRRRATEVLCCFFFARIADARRAKGLRHFEEALTVPPGSTTHHFPNVLTAVDLQQFQRC
jgi:hypothetical protein